MTRMDTSDGTAFYQALRLAQAGVAHAFSTRLETADGDEADALLQAIAGPAAGQVVRICRSRQVHGNAVHVVDGQLVAEANGRNLPVADGIVTARPGVAAAVVTADCLPILLWAEGGAVGAVHAGWRGLLSGVIRNAVETMTQRFAAEPGRMLAAIGPAICAEHFEVGQEVAKAFREAGLGEAVADRKPRPHVDLRRATVLELQRCGVDAGRIEVIDRCTCCHAEEFHSYRRDGNAAGRQVSMIVAG